MTLLTVYKYNDEAHAAESLLRPARGRLAAPARYVRHLLASVPIEMESPPHTAAADAWMTRRDRKSVV